MKDIEIRIGQPGNLATLETLYPAAFPDEDLLPLVRALLAEPGSLVLSLVASVGQTLVGHILLTLCGVQGCDAKVALLGPLAVAPDYQQAGVGAALIQAGLREVETYGVSRVLVLGDPAYYSRFGFTPESEVVPPYPLPDEWREAWQSLPLGAATEQVAGELLVPSAWREPALWAA